MCKLVMSKEIISQIDLEELIESDEYIVVIDTCVFLDFYRYSSMTAKSILSNVEFLKEQIWIPHQIYKEFISSYEGVISPSHNKYQSIVSEVKKHTDGVESKFNDLFNNYNKYHFPKVNELHLKISEQLKEINDAAKSYRNEIKKEIKESKELLKKNDMLEFINKLKEDGKVGESFTPSSLLKIIEMGEKRYALKLPPGYADGGKVTNSTIDPLRPYGDLIIWNSILEKAKETQFNIIFTTSDTKEDWWHLDNNKDILGPREELVAEFAEETQGKTTLLMLPLPEFLAKFSKISKTSSLYSYIEINAKKSMIKKLYKSDEDIMEILISNAYHVNLGHIEEIENFEILEVQLDKHSVDFEDTKAYLSGSFEISVSGFFKEYINKEYSESIEATMILSGKYSLVYVLDIVNGTYKEDEYEIENMIIKESVILNNDYDEIESWKYCSDCGEKEGVYPLYQDDLLCQTCSNSGEYTLCSPCGTFYRLGEYNGDGEKCSKCIAR